MFSAPSFALLLSSFACLGPAGALARDRGIEGCDARLTASSESGAACLPTSISVPERFTDLLCRMCRRSITFQRQCARLAAATDVSVYVRSNLALRSPGRRAWTTFTRATPVSLRADVWVTPGADIVELIAHEFEHVIEWLDGVHRTASEHPPVSAVLRDGRGRVIETLRAIEVGRIVANEVYAGAPPDRSASTK